MESLQHPHEKEKKLNNAIIECKMLYIISNKKFTFKTSHIYKYMIQIKLYVLNTVN